MVFKQTVEETGQVLEALREVEGEVKQETSDKSLEALGLFFEKGGGSEGAALVFLAMELRNMSGTFGLSSLTALADLIQERTRHLPGFGSAEIVEGGRNYFRMRRLQTEQMELVRQSFGALALNPKHKV
jgi:hypothetical protein